LNGLQIEGFPLLLCHRIPCEPGAFLKAIVQIADKEVVHIGQVKPIVADVLGEEGIKKRKAPPTLLTPQVGT